ncbi:hypothetical protein, partial [Escherichia coli]|uniref:hypothetical protein n=1 Tax=Escherichia coli TaxID=562 RepID=UPI0027380DC6
ISMIFVATSSIALSQPAAAATRDLCCGESYSWGSSRISKRLIYANVAFVQPTGPGIRRHS